MLLLGSSYVTTCSLRCQSRPHLLRGHARTPASEPGYEEECHRVKYEAYAHCRSVVSARVVAFSGWSLLYKKA